jgi:hypothetical protein
MPKTRAMEFYEIEKWCFYSYETTVFCKLVVHLNKCLRVQHRSNNNFPRQRVVWKSHSDQFGKQGRRLNAHHVRKRCFCLSETIAFCGSILWSGRLGRFYFVGRSPVLFCGAVACDGRLRRIYLVGRSPGTVLFCGAVACDVCIL